MAQSPATQKSGLEVIDNLFGRWDGNSLVIQGAPILENPLCFTWHVELCFSSVLLKSIAPLYNTQVITMGKVLCSSRVIELEQYARLLQ